MSSKLTYDADLAFAFHEIESRQEKYNYDPDKGIKECESISGRCPAALAQAQQREGSSALQYFDAQGRFHGQATGTNETINFDCANCDVETDWRSLASDPTGKVDGNGGRSSGSCGVAVTAPSNASPSFEPPASAPPPDSDGSATTASGRSATAQVSSTGTSSQQAAQLEIHSTNADNKLTARRLLLWKLGCVTGAILLFALVFWWRWRPGRQGR